MFRPLFKEYKKGRYVVSNDLKYRLCGYQYGFLTDQSVWNIPHNANSKYFLIDVIINGIVVKNYDLQIIDENNLKITFPGPTNGYVNLLIYNAEDFCFEPFMVTVTPTPTNTPTPTVTPTVTPTPSLPVLTIVSQSPPAGTVGTPYSFTYTAIGGLPPYTWAIVGTLPDGLAINPSTGELSGTPNESGSFLIRGTVTDANLVTSIGPLRTLIIT